MKRGGKEGRKGASKTNQLFPQASHACFGASSVCLCTTSILSAHGSCALLDCIGASEQVNNTLPMLFGCILGNIKHQVTHCLLLLLLKMLKLCI